MSRIYRVKSVKRVKRVKRGGGVGSSRPRQIPRPIQLTNSNRNEIKKEIRRLQRRIDRFGELSSMPNTKNASNNSLILIRNTMVEVLDIKKKENEEQRAAADEQEQLQINIKRRLENIKRTSKILAGEDPNETNSNVSNDELLRELDFYSNNALPNIPGAAAAEGVAAVVPNTNEGNIQKFRQNFGNNAEGFNERRYIIFTG